MPANNPSAYYTAPTSNFLSELNLPQNPGSLLGGNTPNLSTPFSFNFDEAVTSGFNATNGGVTGSLPTPGFSDELSLYDKAFGTETTGGFAKPLLGLGQSLLSGYQGFQANKTAQDTLDFQKNVFSKQFEAQRDLLKLQRADQVAARTARDPNYKAPTSSFLS